MAEAWPLPQAVQIQNHSPRQGTLPPPNPVIPLSGPLLTLPSYVKTIRPAQRMNGNMIPCFHSDFLRGDWFGCVVFVWPMLTEFSIFLMLPFIWWWVRRLYFSVISYFTNVLCFRNHCIEDSGLWLKTALHKHIKYCGDHILMNNYSLQCE